MNGSSAGGATTSPACSSRIPIVPVRYAVLPGNPGAKPYAYAGSGYALDQGLPALKEATYTLRSLRPGYVYVYMKGPQGEKLVIHEYDGQGKYRELTYTGLENYHKRNAYREGGSSYWVWADTCPGTAKEVWIGYSTHLWTNAITGKVMASASWRKRLMQPLDMDELTNGEKTPSKQKHVLPASALSARVEECKAKPQRTPLAWSTWSIDDDLPIQTIIAQAANYRSTQPRVPAVVALYDAEGISMDLGLIAAARQHQIIDLQNNATAKTVADAERNLPPCMRLDVDTLIGASTEFHHKNIVAQLIEQSLRSMYVGTATSRSPDRLAKLRGEWHRAQPPGRPIPSDDDLTYEVLTDQNLSPGGYRLGKRVETATYKKFLAERGRADQQLQQLLARMDVATANHDAWLATAEVANVDQPHSVAAALSAYDRDHRVSAQGLEQSIALVMHGMGCFLPGRDDKDPRFSRLQTWAGQGDSPLLMAVAAYNPFKEKADGVGNMFGAADGVIEELYGRFPQTNATDFIAQDVTSVVLKRMNGKTRWDASRTLRDQVAAAAQDANAEKVMGLLSARYKVTRGSLAAASAEAKLTDDVQTFIRAGMAEVRSSTSVKVPGTRTVTVLETNTVRVVPTVKSLGITTGGAGLNMLMLYFNMINLKSALNDLKKQPETQQIANFSSAILGTTAAIAATTVSMRSLYVAASARMAVSLPGASFGAGVTRFLAGKLFGRLIGYPGIILGLYADIQSGGKSSDAGNDRAAHFKYAGAAAIALGSVAMLEGGIALGTAMAGVFGAAGASATVPVIGWVGAVAIIIVGGLVVGAGWWLQSKAREELHTPLELWAARSLFGTRKNDGESRPGIVLDSKKQLPGYLAVAAELQGWYEGYFAPVPLDSSNAKSIGLGNMETEWHGHWFKDDAAEFAVLLPGYVMGQSSWSGGLSSVGSQLAAEKLRTVSVYGVAPTCYVTAQGLVLHYHRTMKGSDDDNLALHLTYVPNQGFDTSAQVEARFELSN